MDTAHGSVVYRCEIMTVLEVASSFCVQEVLLVGGFGGEPDSGSDLRICIPPDKLQNCPSIFMAKRLKLNTSRFWSSSACAAVTR